MHFRFCETSKPINSFDDVPVSKNGKKYLSFHAKQMLDDGTTSPEIQVTVWEEALIKEILTLQFGDVIEIDGVVDSFKRITDIKKAEVY